MSRESAVTNEIYKRHLRLYRFLNDTWIFTELLRPILKERSRELRSSKDNRKKSYTVPKRTSMIFSRRRDEDIGQVFFSQHERGIYETNIVSMVSRMEAFIQECVSITACAYPNKLSVLSDKGGIPLELFLEHESRDDLIRRFVALRCEGLMFGKPSEYLDKAAKVMAIQIDTKLINRFIEIEASRDIIIHNSGLINKLYVEKAGTNRRGQVGEDFIVDRKYFRHVLVTLKTLAGEVQSKVEAVYG